MPLTQITNRISEIYNAEKHEFNTKQSEIEIRNRLEDGSFAQLKFYDMNFQVNRAGQNLMLLKSGECVKLTHISFNDSTQSIELTGKPFRHRLSAYTQVNTLRFNIFKSRNEFLDEIKFSTEDIDGKFWKLDLDCLSMSVYYPLYVEDGKSFSGGSSM